MTNRQQFLYTIKAAREAMLTAGPDAREAEVLRRHLVHLEKLTADGRLILAGRTQDADEFTFGIVIFYADSIEAARTIMMQDPAVAEGVMIARLHPYKVAFSAESG